MVEVRLEKVTKRFGRVVALDSVSLVFEDGKFTALLGPSGSGKTTLLYTVAGIYKPTSGRIYFDGEDVTDLPPNKRNVGLVFQNYALYPHMTVYDNIAFPLRLRKMPERKIDERVREIAKLLHIDELLDRYPSQLSGGQQQRVALARALVKEPTVLLLDEPLSNLDALLRIMIRAELKRLQKDLGITTIYVTHDQAEALSMADTVVVIDKGRIQQVDTPQNVYNRPRNLFVASFIGSPPSNILTAKVVPRGEVACIEVEKARLCLEGERAAKLLRLGAGEVIVAFRPERARLGTEPRSDMLSIPGEVYVVETLGRENVVTLVVGASMVKVVTPPNQVPGVGETYYILVDPRDVMLFDPETELNIDYIEA